MFLAQFFPCFLKILPKNHYDLRIQSMLIVRSKKRIKKVPSAFLEHWNFIVSLAYIWAELPEKWWWTCWEYQDDVIVTSSVPGRETRGEWQKRWRPMHKFYGISRNKRSFVAIIFCKMWTIYLPIALCCFNFRGLNIWGLNWVKPQKTPKKVDYAFLIKPPKIYENRTKPCINQL